MQQIPSGGSSEKSGGNEQSGGVLGNRALDENLAHFGALHVTAEPIFSVDK